MLHRVESKDAAASSFARDKSVAESRHPTEMSGPSDTDGDGWFAGIAQDFYPKPQKPGAILRHLTGYEERNCQRYASAGAQPPGHFIRQLLRSPQGAQWLAALMHGSDAPWWKEHQRNVRLAAAAERFKSEIAQL